MYASARHCVFHGCTFHGPLLPFQYDPAIIAPIAPDYGNDWGYYTTPALLALPRRSRSTRRAVPDYGNNGDYPPPSALLWRWRGTHNTPPDYGSDDWRDHYAPLPSEGLPQRSRSTRRRSRSAPRRSMSTGRRDRSARSGARYPLVVPAPAQVTPVADLALVEWDLTLPLITETKSFNPENGGIYTVTDGPATAPPTAELLIDLPPRLEWYTEHWGPIHVVAREDTITIKDLLHAIDVYFQQPFPEMSMFDTTQQWEIYSAQSRRVTREREVMQTGGAPVYRRVDAVRGYCHFNGVGQFPDGRLYLKLKFAPDVVPDSGEGQW
ncbi:hypothetical protein C8R47DRAFT_1074404 [Mycena vitilis]|nr:hypothetical protein C8R47DRAFT_469689 [Mycena vitilis]KAJ6479937.1 hypothetical protein C8R47DRAFT_1074404 [Mycena vitilis]